MNSLLFWATLYTCLYSVMIGSHERRSCGIIAELGQPCNVQLRVLCCAIATQDVCTSFHDVEEEGCQEGDHALTRVFIMTPVTSPAS